MRNVELALATASESVGLSQDVDGLTPMTGSVDAEMTFADGTWTLAREAQPPDFSQRFTGTFDRAGDTIAGTWEIAPDGAMWEHDFDLTFRRVRQ